MSLLMAVYCTAILLSLIHPKGYIRKYSEGQLVLTVLKSIPGNGERMQKGG